MLSAVCVLGIFLVCFGVAGYQNRVKAEGDTEVTRGVVDKISEVPKTKRDVYDGTNAKQYTLGTKENPMLILEIVPYEEYASFGYQISGCEPVDVKKVQGHGEITQIETLRTAVVEQEKTGAFFFPDEPEADPSCYDSSDFIKKFWESHASVEGYYERVSDGSGHFRQDDNGNILVDDNNGNIIWHSINAVEKQEQYPDQQFSEAQDAKTRLETIGERIYTKRVSSEADPVYITWKHYYYKNNDNFLKDTLQLSQEEADDYSVIVKTITPKELNANPQWVEYADLYAIQYQEYQIGTANIWQKYRKLTDHAESNNRVNSFVNTDSDKNRDLSWDVVEKMYNKITAKKNYAAIIMDANLYTTSGSGVLAGSIKTGSNLEIYDWHLKKTGAKYNGSGDVISNNNVYKLAVMLMSMKPQLFKELYMNPDNPLIKDGKFLLRDGVDQEYWSIYTFLLSDADGNFDVHNQYANWTWEDYESAGIISGEQNRSYVNRRLFTFNSNCNTTQQYLTGAIGTEGSKYTDFQEYYKNHPSVTNRGYAVPSDAVRYILGIGKEDEDDDTEKSIRILDVEPSYDSKNGYSLTKAYVRLMIPKYSGEIELTHMTTAEFIGKSEDLNSTYQMIYMGLDDGAYNHDSNGNTTWNDSSMNGKIYFHSGDSMMSAEWNISTNKKKRTHSVKFLANGNNSGLLRFPGNDITELKKKELENFLAAGYPIVAAGDLYNRNSLYIDQSSVISKFVEESTAMGSAKSFYKSSDTSKIYAALETAGDVVTFSDGAQLANSTEETPHYRSQMPIRYQDKTVENESGKNGYLKRNALGESELDFGYILKDTEHAYGYHIYMDQNQDGKFAEEELYAQGDAQTQGQTGEIDEESDGAFTTISYTLAKSYVGMIEWKFEIYRKDNPAIRYEETGCSAAKIQNASDKKQVKILQIVPNNDVNLNLNDSRLFKKYYSQLDDYKIWTNNNNYVDVMTADEYMAVFSGAGNQFVYDESADLEFEEGALNPSQFPSGAQRLNKDYNMIIVGFGDTYGGTNISNENGALDFIKFFIAEGKSVLFTHDLTSLYNLKKENASIFGYTANALLRDTMGMNRYGAISNQASQEEQKKIAQLQQNNVAANSNYYETIADDAKQGFTYYAMKRLGWSNNNNGTPLDTLKKQKVPYRYMINSYQNDESICGKSELSKTTGFNDNNDITTRVTQTNQGQITEYPYKIDPEFTIARTHGQWYQLNMEDPEVTVWYCLADNENGNPAAWNDKEQYGDGTGATYGVSPNDAANNYYIYSKGNVFYSGVGHSTVDGDMEAKLFVNTMIAAYRAAYESPTVRVTNGSWCDDVSTEDDRHYKVLIPESELSPEELMEDEAASTVDIMKDDTYKITFRPEDHNPVTSQLTASVYYADASGKKIADVEEITALDGSPVSKNKKGEWELNNMQEYAFKYPEMYLQEWTDEAGQTHEKQCRIVFKIKNTKNKIPGYTKLDISTLPMFQLD